MCVFSRGEECKCRKKSSHNVHLLVLVHNISRLYVEVGDHNLVLAPTSILAVIYSSELEKVSLDFWSGVVVFLIRHHHVTFKSSELERYRAPCLACEPFEFDSLDPIYLSRVECVESSQQAVVEGGVKDRFMYLNAD